MPEKYHIETKPVPPRRPRIGKYGIIDWREDCARCHNCVKKACVYDRHRDEIKYIRNMEDVDALFFDCMGCFSCVQECTKNLLRLSINPEYQKLGNDYWTPQIIQTTWLQAETAKIPVSGAGYGGRFSGYGFDSMWTDMSEIVRPTRDGIHGREYISTAVDIGKKNSFLVMKDGKLSTDIPPIISTPMPVIIDMMPENYALPMLDAVIPETAYRTELIALIDSKKWPSGSADSDKYLPHIAFYFSADAPLLPPGIIRKTALAEIENSDNVNLRIKELKEINPDIVVSVRVELNGEGIRRAVELSGSGVEVIHVVADTNGKQTGVKDPLFIKDMIRIIHKSLIETGRRDDVTLISGGGIALPEHVAKALICGTDLVSIELPLLAALECHLCSVCAGEKSCPAKIRDAGFEYSAGRMTNLIAAWHDQMVELMGAMGIRDARRLRGDVGRAMFFEQLEEETFGKLFGTRKQA
ncbi:MAG TPA: glutamate synthase-related protein [Spirochaetota bacterium]|nr:glutamate synthase-related protein [Spirochaetota bacterium]HPS86409.1 glutamate synthase-related protein [Spirochaetota bacterium]